MEKEFNTEKPKTWDETSQDDKIERLRNELLSYQWRFSQMNQLQDQINRLSGHSHKENGEIVVPLNPHHSSGNSLGVMTPGASMTRNPLK